MAGAGGGAAHDGFTVGLSGSLAGSAPGASLRALLPLTTLEPASGDEAIEVALRGDLSWTPGALPAPALGVQFGQDLDEVEGYAGAGVGVAFGAPGGPLASGYALAGVRLEIAPRLALALEGSLGVSGDLIAPAVGIAVEYGLGSAR